MCLKATGLQDHLYPATRALASASAAAYKPASAYRTGGFRSVSPSGTGIRHNLSKILRRKLLHLPLKSAMSLGCVRFSQRRGHERAEMQPRNQYALESQAVYLQKIAMVNK